MRTRVLRAPRGTLIAAALALPFAALLAYVSIGLARAAAPQASPCAGEPTVSADGRVVRGSECGERLVVYSEQVRKVVGGGGDDLILVNPWVEVIEGGEGDDVIYGELTEAEEILEEAEEGERGGAPGGPGGEEGEHGDEEATGPVYRPLYRIARSSAREGSSGAAATVSTDCTGGCYGGSGNQTISGGAGNDKIFGQRGNDTLYGNAGNDALYGGVGDDGGVPGTGVVSGGAGNDLVSGGYGYDQVNGNEGSDLVRGDATIDRIYDTGSSGSDTISYATGVAPGFTGSVGISGFPADDPGEERGVDVRLDGGATSCGFVACNNSARYGGGVDEGDLSGFENVIGTPFADRIVGDSGANRIDGGGGADVIEGGGGNDTLYGGTDGDYIDGGSGTDTGDGQAGVDNCFVESASSCSPTSESVEERDRSKIAVGYMTSHASFPHPWVALYLVGSESRDEVNVKYFYEGPTGHVTFTRLTGSADFDTSSGAASPNCSYSAGEVDCTLPKPLDAINLAGMAGDDYLNIAGGGAEWEDTVTPYLLGGQDDDLLNGSGQTEDVLVDGDGTGDDTLYGYGYDEALVNNEGADSLQGGNGNDLLLSVATCGGDTLQGAEGGSGDGEAVNNTSWAKMPSGGVTVHLEEEEAGDHYSGGAACSSGSLDAVRNIDHLEGSNQDDALFGDAKDNFILGRIGEDSLYGKAGNDTLQGQDGFHDTLAGNGNTDTCHYDHEIDVRETCESGEMSVPPLTVTQDASSVDADSATLNGTVDPQSKATTFWFQWGTTTSYGNETTHESAGSGPSPVSKSKGIGGLDDDTTYHFRIVANNSEGNSYGKDKSFTTDDVPPPSVTTGSASNLRVEGETGVVELNGTVDPNGTATEYHFQWGTEPGVYPNSTSKSSAGSGTSPVSVEKTIEGLEGDGIYYFRLVAESSEGTTNGAEKSLETPDWSPDATTEAASGVGTTEATLHAKVTPNGFATAYQFEWGTTAEYGSKAPVEPESVGSGNEPVAVGETLEGLDPETVYHYRVAATSAEGTTYGEDKTLATEAGTHLPRFEAAAYPATVAAEQDPEAKHTFDFYGASVSCDQASFAGEMSQHSATLELAPEYSECESSGEYFIETISVNGCDYVLDAGDAFRDGEYVGSAEIICPEGEEIVLKGPFGICEVEVPPQGDLEAVAYANSKSSPAQIEASFALAGLEYTQVDTPFCPFTETATRYDGEYSGGTIVAAENEAEEAIGIAVDGEPTEHDPRFEADEYPATIAAEQDPEAKHTFDFYSDDYSCEEATFTGGLSEHSETLKLAPGYSECENQSEITHTIAANGCEYLLDAGEASEGGYAGTADIVCPGEEEIVIKGPFGICEVHIPPQGDIEAITYTNPESSPQHVAASFALSGLEYTEEDTAFCPFEETVTRYDGEYGGGTTIEAENEAEEAIGIAVDGS